MSKKCIEIFDSTLRDGAQGEDISFSLEDKIKVAIALDKLGVSYIEAGNPGSNPKDMEFFKRMKEIKLKNSKLSAFGATRKANIKAEDDNNIKIAPVYLEGNELYFLENNNGKISVVKKNGFTKYYSDDFDKDYIISTQIYCKSKI